MYFPKGSLDSGTPGEFSRQEIKQLLIAITVLTIAFSFPLSQSSLLFGTVSFSAIAGALPISLLSLLTAFICHELSHKFMAQRYKLWSEFRMFPAGLLISLLIALSTGTVLAAPGAVMFRGEIRPFEMGRIAAAGSLANIIIAWITLPLYIFITFELPLIGKITGFICLINALLATFNLLPIRPLDGEKVIKWHGIIWAAMFSAAFAATMIILPRFVPYF